jgi:hypothetical protein
MKTKLLALMLAAFAPFAVMADVSYSFAEASYQLGGEVDDGVTPIDTDGFLLKGSFAVNDNWFVEFDYGMLSTDPSAADITSMSLLAGWHGELIYVKGGYESLEVDACASSAPPCSFDDSGYNLDFGVRSMVGENFELNGHVGISDLGNFDSFTNYGFGAVWSFGENMGVTFNYDMRSGDTDDFSTYGFGFRLDFN